VDEDRTVFRIVDVSYGHVNFLGVTS
jgi:hypothetical protein